jgi:starch synthase
MKILFCAAEATPYAKSGGLADVAGALPAALAARGHDVRLVLPRYGWIPRHSLRPLPGAVIVALGSGSRFGALLEDPAAPVPVYLLEHDAYFDRPWPYGPPDGAYGDNCERFSFLSHGALAVCAHQRFTPDVIHANDWHTALVPALLDTGFGDPALQDTASVLTIHNVGYAGEFPKEDLIHTGLGWEHFTFLEFEIHDRLSLLKGGIAHATKLTTVSPTHALEIQTPEGGFGLDGMLRQRAADLHGILNGIDEAVWDPRHDPNLPARFGPGELSGKARCKAHLQQTLGLPVRPEVPLIGLVSRLAHQKGTDVVAAAMERLLTLDLQLCILGSGDPHQEQALLRFAHHHPQRLAVSLGYNEALAHRIEGGADFFLMPSRYEPCGLNQLYSQRYGTLPIVRSVGGLRDTVESYDEATGAGTGFVFESLDPGALFDVVGWAVWAFYHRRDHLTEMAKRAMLKDFSWNRAAGAYEAVYEEAVATHRGR